MYLTIQDRCCSRLSWDISSECASSLPRQRLAPFLLSLCFHLTSQERQSEPKQNPSPHQRKENIGGGIGIIISYQKQMENTEGRMAQCPDCRHVPTCWEEYWTAWKPFWGRSCYIVPRLLLPPFTLKWNTVMECDSAGNGSERCAIRFPLPSMFWSRHILSLFALIDAKAI